MKKRLCLVLAIVLGLSLFLAGCGGGGSETEGEGNGDVGEVYQLNVHSHDPEASATGKFLNAWAAQVEEASDGRLQLNIFHAGALGGPRTAIEMVQNGTADISWGLQSFFPGQFPVTDAFSLPMRGITSAAQASAAFWDVYTNTDYLDAEYDEFHVLLLHANCESPISSKSTKIEAVDQIKGMNIRALSGPPNDFILATGAGPINVEIGELYSAIENNTIDAIIADWHIIYARKFYEQLNYYVDEAITVNPYFLLMNKDKYNSLPGDLQAILDEASGAAALDIAGSAWDDIEAELRDIILERGGEIYKLSDEEHEKLQTIADQVTADWIEKMNADGYPGEEIYDAVMEAVEKHAE
jgi:TRAP-type C4-dicarboxylate transport system substrate-binding protein